MFDDFDFENAWILSGQLVTTQTDAIAAFLTTRFPVDAHDSECACDVTVTNITVTIFLRHDAVIGN